MISNKTLKIFNWVSLTLIPLLFLVFFILYQIDVNFYKQVTVEDGVIEWPTFIFIFLSGLGSLYIAIQLKKTKEYFFVFFLLFGIALVLASFEEISWGQRIFDVQSPDFFIENSDQKEINVHNVVQKWGQDISIFGYMYDFKTKHLVGFCFFLYGVVCPLLSLNKTFKALFRKCHIVIPPLRLSIGFFLSAVLMLDKPTGKEEELGEFLFSICFFIFILGQYFAIKNNPVSQH